jgi:polyhydroxyalkanoate synthase subunit PhaC
MATRADIASKSTRIKAPERRKLNGKHHAHKARASAAAPKPVPEVETDTTEELAPAASPLLALEATDVLEAVGRLAVAAVKSPGPLLKRMGTLTSDLAGVLMGEKKIEPAKNDRRFQDSSWHDNDYYQRLLQVYLAVAQVVRDLPNCVDLDKREELARIGFNFLADGLSPTNNLLGNPAALKRALDTGGASLREGLRNFAWQMWKNGGHPSQVRPDAFRHGETVAATPGKVVFRHEMFELLQYQPTTATVYDCPVLFLCSPVNPYYVLDLSPGKSLFEYVISQGFTVFAISLRNPGPEHRHWSLDHYARAILKATNVVRSITGSATLNLATACAGGVIGALLAAALAARKDRRLRSLTSLVSVIDLSDAGGALPLANKKMAQRSVTRTAKRGVLHGQRIFWMFSLIRPNEAFWSYWVDNFLMGKTPPLNDLLFWANENTNLPAALLRDLLEVYVHNRAIVPGGMSILGRPVDLSQVKIDMYTLAAERDHLMPWQGCYRSLQHFSGNRTFILQKKGHIMALLDSPSAGNSTFYTREGGLDLDAASWRASAQVVNESWWPHWCAWLAERSGTRRPARKFLGSAMYPALADAPGDYVRFKENATT